ncbi:MAG: TraR/DksA C4-type zinc finger protein, partial [Verrucomicrobia bacterium]|nr:TraR/DksA C4-type zinc finger protein [Verrucomicrobiota bacterium]
RFRAAASASDVLGMSRRSRAAFSGVKVPKRWQWHWRVLLSLRDRLMGERSVLAKTSSAEPVGYSMHMADAATDDFDRDLALSELSAEQDLLYEVEAALHRIADGTYGQCEATGKPIPAARLRAIPWTRFSGEAETQLEKAGAVHHAHLAELVSVQHAGLATSDENGEEDNGPLAPEEQLSPVTDPGLKLKQMRAFQNNSRSRLQKRKPAAPDGGKASHRA